MDYKSILQGQVQELLKIQDKMIEDGDISLRIVELSKQILELVKHLDGDKSTTSRKESELLKLILEQLLELKKSIYTTSGCDMDEVSEIINNEKEQINVMFNGEESKRLYQLVSGIEEDVELKTHDIKLTFK